MREPPATDAAAGLPSRIHTHIPQHLHIHTHPPLCTIAHTTSAWPPPPLRREVYAAALAALLTTGSVEDAVTQMNVSFAKLLLDPQQKQFRQLVAASYMAIINYNNIDYLNGTNVSSSDPPHALSWMSHAPPCPQHSSAQ